MHLLLWTTIFTSLAYRQAGMAGDACYTLSQVQTAFKKFTSK